MRNIEDDPLLDKFPYISEPQQARSRVARIRNELGNWLCRLDSDILAILQLVSCRLGKNNNNQQHKRVSDESVFQLTYDKTAIAKIYAARICSSPKRVVISCGGCQLWNICQYRHFDELAWVLVPQPGRANERRASYTPCSLDQHVFLLDGKC